MAIEKTPSTINQYKQRAKLNGYEISSSIHSGDKPGPMSLSVLKRAQTGMKVPVGKKVVEQK